MKLQHEIGCQLDMLVPLVNELQHVSIAGDLALRTISRLWLRVTADEKLERGARERNTLKAIRGFRALDDRDLAEILQHIRRALFEQILLALALADSADGRHDGMGQAEIFEDGRCERTHGS